MSSKYSRVMLKISGEVLEGPKGSGIDHETVKNLCQEIITAQKNTDAQIAIVVGGGNIWRYRDFKDSGIERVTSDYMGMTATIMNAVALSSGFKNLGAESAVWSALEIPHITNKYNRPDAMKDLENHKIVICAGGTGNPFFTTDSAAALRALELDCDVLLKATKVDGVYDKDPTKHNDAKKYPEISFQEVLAQELGIMDLTAVSLCIQKPLPILVFNLLEKGNIEKAISGKAIGSLIS